MSEPAGAGKASTVQQDTVLSSADLLLDIMLQLARLSHGWGRDFWLAAAPVCHLWCEAVVAVRPFLEVWTTFSFTVKDYLKMEGEAVRSSTFLSGGACASALQS